ncbi:MAG: hypothetical protein ACJ77A_19555 [Actinomycetota bacterium]
MQANRIEVDPELPANRGVLAYLEGRAPGAPLVQPPEEHPDPYLQAGSHPDIVERLWNAIGPALPEDCRAMVLGTPGLVHPHAQVVMAVALGTSYALRLEADDLQAAVAAGADLVHEYLIPKGWVLDLPKQFGSDWVFGSWEDREPAWCARAYHTWNSR